MLSHVELMNDLIDCYGVLLTAKQQELLKMRYQDDLSLTEISEEIKISRAAASDLIRRSEKLLEEYEEKLHLLKQSTDRDSLYKKLLALNDSKVSNLVVELINLESKESRVQ